MSRDYTIYRNQPVEYIDYKWNPLGDQNINSPVHSLYSCSSGIYAAGQFYGYLDKFARWDGLKWNQCGEFSPFTQPGYAAAGFLRGITEWKGVVYVGVGQPAFSPELKDSIICKYNQDNNNLEIIKFNNETYNCCEDFSINWLSNCLGLYSDNNYIYYIGMINAGDPIAGKRPSIISKWDGKKWSLVDTPEDIQDDLFWYSYTQPFSSSQGIFTCFNEQKYWDPDSGSYDIYIRVWNGTSWSRIEPPIQKNYSQDLNCILSSSDGLYVGGWNISKKLNGGVWQDVLIEPDLVVRSMVSSSQGIYMVGSNLLSSSTSGIHNIVLWNGNSVVQLSNKLTNYNGYGANINSILTSSDGLYVGGDFAQYASSSFVSKYNGIWYNLGDGILPLYTAGYGHVSSIVSASNGLYIAGTFRDWSIDNNVVFYNGSEYEKIEDSGFGITSTYRSLVSCSEGIILSSNQNIWDTTSSSWISEQKIWNGSSWSDFNTDFMMTYVLSGADGLYAIGGKTTSPTPYAPPDPIFMKYSASTWQTLYTQPYVNETFKYNYIMSSSNAIYMVDGREDTILNKWNGVGWDEIQLNIPVDEYILYPSFYQTPYVVKDDILYIVSLKSYYTGPRNNFKLLYTSGSEFVTESLTLPELFTNIMCIGTSENGIYLASWKDIVGSSQTPWRVYLYDGTNIRPIGDYFNGAIAQIKEYDNNTYLYGSTTKHGNYISELTKNKLNIIKPLAFNNNNNMTINRSSPYQVKIGSDL